MKLGGGVIFNFIVILVNIRESIKGKDEFFINLILGIRIVTHNVERSHAKTNMVKPA